MRRPSVCGHLGCTAPPCSTERVAISIAGPGIITRVIAKHIPHKQTATFRATCTWVSHHQKLMTEDQEFAEEMREQCLRTFLPKVLHALALVFSWNIQYGMELVFS